MIVFLDFDGVTHGIDSSISGMTPLFEKKCLIALEEALKPYDFNLVISSTWRLEYSLDKIKSLLGEFLGSQVIGSTPDIPPKQLFNLNGSRQIECEAWLSENPVNGSVIAIDDNVRMFDTMSVYGTKSAQGFVISDIKSFQEMVENVTVK
jgi:hypothetical protein